MLGRHTEDNFGRLPASREGFATEITCPVRGLLPSAVPRRDTVCASSSYTRRRPMGSLSLAAWARKPSKLDPNDVLQVYLSRGFNQALGAAGNDALTSGAFNTSCTTDMNGLLPAPDIATSKVQRATGNFTTSPASLKRKLVRARLRWVSSKH